jgi:DNA-binding MarR family transcriptional regulator
MLTDVADLPPAVRALVPISTEAQVWWALRSDPEQSVRALGRLLGVPKTQVHEALRRLIDEGLVQCEVPSAAMRPPRYRVSDKPMERRIA